MAKKIMKEKTCCFEYLDKAKKQMVVCGRPAVYLYQEKYLLCETCCQSGEKSTMITRLDQSTNKV